MEDRVIAIIDDDVFVRDSVNRLVRSMGYCAEKYSSTEEFLASSSLPDVRCIISDVNLADGTASRLQDRLASIGHDIPIIFMTARLDRAVETMLMKAGAVHVLAKPFHQNDMAFHIAAALQRSCRNEGGPASDSTARAAAEVA